MQPESSTYLWLKNYGLTKNMTLIVLLSIVHLNKSKYIGNSTLDSYQYIASRILPFLSFFMLMVRYDYAAPT